MNTIRIYANSHYVTPRPTLTQAIKKIKIDLLKRLEELNKNNQLLEAQRLEQRTNFDLEMMEATGSCNGIENYSRYLTGRKPGEPPPTLFEYIPNDAIIFADESHVAIPQLGGMYRGDHRRKLCSRYQRSWIWFYLAAFKRKTRGENVGDRSRWRSDPNGLRMVDQRKKYSF